MDVQISFAGLCMFAPDSDSQTVSVVLPKTGDTVHRHRPVLLYDIGHTLPQPRITGQYAHLALAGRTLELGDGTGSSLDICAEIVDLKPVVPQGATTLTGLGPNVVSVVTLSSGRMTAVAPGACWNWYGSTRRMAHRARWATTATGSTLTVSVVAPGDSNSTVNVPLSPINGTLSLLVYHMVADEFPPDPVLPGEPAPNDTPAHFAAYHRLFSIPITEPLPLYVDNSGTCGPNTCQHSDDSGLSAFSCMLAQVTK